MTAVKKRLITVFETFEFSRIENVLFGSDY